MVSVAASADVKEREFEVVENVEVVVYCTDVVQADLESNRQLKGCGFLKAANDVGSGGKVVEAAVHEEVVKAHLVCKKTR